MGNYEECINLQFTKEQTNFLASNTFRLAQSYVALLHEEIPNITYAIYNDDIMVGFIMMEYDKVEEKQWGVNGCYEDCFAICSFMIDKRYQGRGYGKQALAKAIEYIKTFPYGRASAVYLSYDTDNVVARHLYASFGFVETGEFTSSGEAKARLAL